MKSNTKLIANHESMKNSKKRNKIQQVALLLKGALNAEHSVGLKMNIPKAYIENIIEILPSLKAPTISQLYGTDWFSIETIIEESIVRDLIPKLINKGADGIIEYPLNKIVSVEDRI